MVSKILSSRTWSELFANLHSLPDRCFHPSPTFTSSIALHCTHSLRRRHPYLPLQHHLSNLLPHMLYSSHTGSFSLYSVAMCFLYPLFFTLVVSFLSSFFHLCFHWPRLSELKYHLFREDSPDHSF